MVTAEAVITYALSFKDACQKPHFDRIAFTINNKIFATLSQKSQTINLMFDEPTQFIFCKPGSDIIFPVPNKWGLRGATTINLKKANKKLVMQAIQKAISLKSK